jgi:hypothetical protein
MPLSYEFIYSSNANGYIDVELQCVCVCSY